MTVVMFSLAQDASQVFCCCPLSIVIEKYMCSTIALRLSGGEGFGAVYVGGGWHDLYYVCSSTVQSSSIKF